MAVESNQADHVNSQLSQRDREFAENISQAMCKLQHGNKWLNAVVLETLPDSKVRIHVQLPCVCKLTFLHVHGCLNKIQEGISSIEANIMNPVYVFNKWFSIAFLIWTCNKSKHPGCDPPDVISFGVGKLCRGISVQRKDVSTFRARFQWMRCQTKNSK